MDGDNTNQLFASEPKISEVAAQPETDVWFFEDGVNSSEAAVDDMLNDADAGASAGAASGAATAPTVDLAPLSEGMRLRAISAGLSPEDLAGVPESYAEKMIAAWEKRNPQPASKVESEAAEPVRQQESEDDPFDFEVPDGEFDETLERALKGVKHLGPQMRKQLQEQAEQIASMRYERDLMRLDRMVSKVEGAEEVFGAGDILDFDLDDPSQKAFVDNRLMLAEKADALRAGYKATGQKVPADAELIRQAATLAFPDHFQKMTQRQIASSVDRTRGSRAMRPGNQTRDLDGRFATPEDLEDRRIRASFPK